jgi:F-type H+-transporting ATPase subunit a
MHTVSISAEKLFTLFGFLPVTNTLLTAWVVMLIIVLIAFLGTRKLKEVPSGTQNFLEVCIGGLESVMASIIGSSKQAREFFGIVATIFIFVLFSNWFGLIPGVGSIMMNIETPQETQMDEAAEVHHAESAPLFRAASSDLSFTIAIALWSIIYVQYIGFKHLKLGYLKKFINLKSPILFFVGILEIISELGKIISFSFRLFGNIFAGEVLLVVMTFLVPVLIPVPFYGLEVFVGLVQAGVFAALTLVFVKSAVAHH